jgi:dienelactone hydrolase
VPRALPLLLALALVAGCGGSAAPGDGIPRLDFAYDDAPLGWVDRGAVNHGYPISIHDVSFTSGGARVEGFLLLPPGETARPAVVVVHGSGGDRSELLTPAAWLAARGVVVLTITAPSSKHPPARPTTLAAFLRAQREVVVRDVVAVRRAIDALTALKTVDGDRVGYVGWSAGAKLGTFVAASDDRVDALALLSAGADPLAAFVAHAPADAKDEVRQVLGSVDPLRYVAWAKPGSLLLEDARGDEVVPQSALRNMIGAAPERTTVRWYPGGHRLTPKAYADAFAWLARKLDVSGPPVAGARTGP